MKLGLFLNSFHYPDTVPADAFDLDLEMIVRAEELGYEEALVAEHFTCTWAKSAAPDLLIAGALQRTRRIRLGTGVSNLPYHHPALLAHRIATLDHLARGRFLWGIGAGGLPGDVELFRVDTEHGEHRALTRETLEAILGLWEHARAAGGAGPARETGHWRMKLPARNDWGFGLHLAPYQRPHPPIAVAGLSPKSETLALAGERGWIPMSIFGISVPTLAGHWEAYAEAAERAGTVADRSKWRIAREVYVAETDAQARREALEGTQAYVWREYHLKVFGELKALALLKTDPEMPDEAVTPEWLLDNNWIVGSPETVAAKLRTLHAEVGGFGMLLQTPWDWGDRQDKNFRSLELLAREVMPRLVDLQ